MPARGGSAGGGACQGGACLEGGCLPEGGVPDQAHPPKKKFGAGTPPKIWSRHPPPVDRMTHACENITLAKTSFRPVIKNKFVYSFTKFMIFAVYCSMGPPLFKLKFIFCHVQDTQSENKRLRENLEEMEGRIRDMQAKFE